MNLDPESYSWHPLDDEYLRRLDSNKYVSLSREHRLGINSLTGSSSNDHDIRQDAEGKDVSGHSSNQESTDSAAHAQHSDNTEGDNKADESIFKVGMPGIMTPDELSKEVDLDHVRIKLRRTCADAHVRASTSHITSPSFH